MKVSMMSSLVLAAALLTQSAFALEHTQGQGADVSWISVARGPNMSITAATLSVGTASASLQIHGYPTLDANDGSQFLLDGVDVKVVRVSGSSKECGRVFGAVGASCSLDNAVVTLQDSEGGETTVFTKASVTWINQDILISLGAKQTFELTIDSNR